eukprot:TRINITY_DN3394_c0_g2_i1.p1 TRINITY_DN3394_c0_g2~~TRINITY_DN3394_c0_g2_i1.p1  ORF type:complete len:269 (-),score=25.31 TRINITY_DN3394_c0_g2_i1:29-835(-)
MRKKVCNRVPAWFISSQPRLCKNIGSTYWFSKRSYTPMNTSGVFEEGKVPPELLSEIVFPRLGAKDKRVIISPKLGVDTAIVKIQPYVDPSDKTTQAKIVVTSDPITGSTKDIGRLIVIVNANDIATSGSRPRWMILNVLLPLGSDKQLLTEIMDQVNETAKKLNISIIGGHTEITSAVNRVVCMGTMIGEVEEHGRHLSTSDAQEGDHIILTKGVGIEGTCILLQEGKRRELFLKRLNSLNDPKKILWDEIGKDFQFKNQNLSLIHI